MTLAFHSLINCAYWLTNSARERESFHWVSFEFLSLATLKVTPGQSELNFTLCGVIDGQAQAKKWIWEAGPASREKGKEGKSKIKERKK